MSSSSTKKKKETRKTQSAHRSWYHYAPKTDSKSAEVDGRMYLFGVHLSFSTTPQHSSAPCYSITHFELLFTVFANVFKWLDINSNSVTVFILSMHYIVESTHCSMWKFSEFFSPKQKTKHTKCTRRKNCTIGEIAKCMCVFSFSFFFFACLFHTFYHMKYIFVFLFSVKKMFFSRTHRVRSAQSAYSARAKKKLYSNSHISAWFAHTFHSKFFRRTINFVSATQLQYFFYNNMCIGPRAIKIERACAIKQS